MRAPSSARGMRRCALRDRVLESRRLAVLSVPLANRGKLGTRVEPRPSQVFRLLWGRRQVHESTTPRPSPGGPSGK